MKTLKALFAFLLLLASSLTGGPTSAQARVQVLLKGKQLPYCKGVNVTLFGNDTTMDVNVPLSFGFLDSKSLGINCIIFTYPINVDGVCGKQVSEDPALTPNLDRIAIVIKEVLSRDFQIWLRPIINESSLNGSWRGALNPGCKTNGEVVALQAWFDSYENYLGGLARLCEVSGCTGIVVGTELATLERATPALVGHWTHLISDLRLMFDGNIAYAMNWSPQTLPGFYKSLDVLMVDAYFDLYGLGPHATADQIARAWEHWLPTFKVWAASLNPNTSIVISELGTSPRTSSYSHPWENIDAVAAFDQDAQVNYFMGSCLFMKNRLGSLINGFSWWGYGFYNYFQPVSERGSDNFLDSPTESAVRDCNQLFN